jgi:hypothetical protein
MLDIEEAPLDGPARVGFHSPEGFGKTFFSAFFPNPVYVAAENGFPRDMPIRPMRAKNLREWPQVLEFVHSLTVDDHPHETVVFDTMDWLEPIIHAYVCERDSGRQTEMNKGGRRLISIEDYGYGKGYIAAEEEMRRLIALLDEMQYRRRIHVVMLMHSSIRKFSNPSGVDYDRFEPKMNKLAAAVVKEWVENLLFGYYEVAVGKLEDEKKAKGVSTGKRLIGTRNNSAYDAKNRVQLPDVYELTDPGILIPYLLGEVKIESPVKLTVGKPPKVEPAKKLASVPAEPDGKSAHHPDRVDDEKKRADAALSKAREPASVDDAKTEARTFTEPKKRALPPEVAAAKDASPKSAPVDEKRLAILTELIMRAGEEKGAKYRKTVEKWCKIAAGDPDNLDAIIEDVNKTLGPKPAGKD